MLHPLVGCTILVPDQDRTVAGLVLKGNQDRVNLVLEQNQDRSLLPVVVPVLQDRMLVVAVPTLRCLVLIPNWTPFCLDPVPHQRQWLTCPFPGTVCTYIYVYTVRVKKTFHTAAFNHHRYCMVQPLFDRCVTVARPSLNRSISAVGLVQMRYAPLHNYHVTVCRCSSVAYTRYRSIGTHIL